MVSENGAWLKDDRATALEGARECRGTAYELGPEAKELDYTLLVEWVKGAGHRAGGRDGCDGGSEFNTFSDPCTCGLTDARKAAGL